MASGLEMCRINRPNIWLHRPARITKSILAKTEPSTYGPSRHAAVALHRLLSPAADIASQVRLNWSTSADGIKRLLFFACLSAALDALGRDPKIINSVMRLRTLNVIFDKS